MAKMLSVMALALALAAACKSGPSGSSGSSGSSGLSNSAGPSSAPAPSSEAKPETRAEQDRRVLAEAMAKIASFKEDMCKCQAGDKACADKIDRDMKTWSDSMKGKEPDPQNLTEEDKQKVMDMFTEMAKCQQAAYGP